MPAIHQNTNPQWNSKGDPLWSRRLLVVWFLLAVTAPGVGHVLRLFDLTYIEVAELRRPVERPRIPYAIHQIPGTFKHLDDYLNDHFGFRSMLITADSLMNYSLGGRVGDVVRGRDGWLFDSTALVLDECRGLAPYTDKELARFMAILRQREDWTRAHGIKLLTVVAPLSYDTYGADMPAWMQPVGPSRADQFFKAAKAAGMDALDLRPEFKKLGATDGDLYYKTDLHWNYRGGYQAYRMVMDRLRAQFPAAKAVAPDAFEFARKSGVAGMGHTLKINLSGWLPEHNYFDIIWRGGPPPVLAYRRVDGVWSATGPGTEHKDHHETIAIINPAAKGPRVLVFRDSFGNALAPFLNATFGEVVYANHNYLGFDTRLVEQVKPDIIIYLYVEEKFFYDPEPIYDRDSAAPPDCNLMTYRNVITLDDQPVRLEANANTITPVTIVNTGNWTWPHDGKRRVVMTHRWLDPATRKPLVMDYPVTELAADLPWNVSFKPGVYLRAPAQPGKYILQILMRQENTTDFDARGASTAECLVKITK